MALLLVVKQKKSILQRNSNMDIPTIIMDTLMITMNTSTITMNTPMITMVTLMITMDTHMITMDSRMITKTSMDTPMITERSMDTHMIIMTIMNIPNLQSILIPMVLPQFLEPHQRKPQSLNQSHRESLSSLQRILSCFGLQLLDQLL